MMRRSISGAAKSKNADVDLSFDHDVEKRLVSCVLLDPGGQLPRVLAAGLRTEHFHHEAHRLLFETVGALWQTKGCVDAVVLVDFLREQGDLDKVGHDYIAECAAATATASSAPHYAEIVLRHAERREILLAGEAVLDAIRSGDDNAEIVKAATSRFTTIQSEYSNRVRPVNAGEYLRTPAPDVEAIIEGLLDKGDRHFIVSQSKAGKSWFALQQAMSIASGLPFLEWSVSGPKRVAVAQFELKKEQYHKRVRKMGAALDLTPTDLGGRLDIFNLRGVQFDVFDIGSDYDVLYLDPLYVMLAQAGADENSASDVGRVLSRISSWQRQTEAAVVVVHHGTKGRLADRQVVDRGAGSGAIGRDLDGMLTLSPARDDPETCLVVDHIARNYRHTAPFVVRFDAGSFNVTEDVVPVAETSQSAGKKSKGPSVEEIADQIGKTISKPILTEDLKTRIREQFGVGLNKTDGVVQHLETRGFARWKTAEKPPRSMFGPESAKP